MDSRKNNGRRKTTRVQEKALQERNSDVELPHTVEELARATQAAALWVETELGALWEKQAALESEERHSSAFDLWTITSQQLQDHFFGADGAVSNKDQRKKQFSAF